MASIYSNIKFILDFNFGKVEYRGGLIFIVTQATSG